MSSSLDTEHYTRIYALGSNGSGQLGIGHANDVSAPQPVLHSTSVTGVRDIRCGGNHTIIMFSDHQIATTGYNSDGRCMTTTETSSCQPTQMLLPPEDRASGELGLRHVAATWSASIIVCGKEFSNVSGTGHSGELGLGLPLEVARHPTIIPNFPPTGTTVVKIAACMGHVAVVLSNGEAWGWGKGRKGQLGEPLENRWEPSRIKGIPFFVVDAVCGKDFTCFLGPMSTGELLILGLHGSDRFGVQARAPTAVPGWKQIAASWGSIFVLFESGQVMAWGRDDHGQLPSANLPPLTSVAAGSEHCLGLTTSGTVVAWGWGEHGNCGVPTDPSGDVKGSWNELKRPRPGTVTAVFAGCATSFIVADEIGPD